MAAADLAGILDGFHPAVSTWFTENFAAPSPPQLEGWPAIRAGRNVLILAATGTGKTLAAFLEILSNLYTYGTGRGIQVVYVSPLKALNNDVARNLLQPLEGIAEVAKRLGLEVPEIKVAVRTGDTSQSARQAMLRKPPDILITTPESLFLMLSSPKARAILAPTHTIIVDEIHALAGNKRGIHLALSLERLERLAGHELQRIGLSATQRPLELIARFLGGQKSLVPRPVQILNTQQAKQMAVKVQVGPQSFEPVVGSTIWPQIYERVLQEIRTHRSTLVFVNARAWAEKVALGINDLAGEMIARTHHGSLSRQAREDVETALKKGELRALVCTSTLELGIDVGAIDLVIQIASPRSVSSALQRTGRSGHVLGAASEGLILTKSPDDLLDAAWVAREMRQGAVEETHIAENCLDVLAQHVVSMVAVEDWTLSDALALAQQCYPFRNLSMDQLVSVVEMLSGRYPARDYIELRPKVAWDRVTDTLHALPGTRAAAVAGVGTIPDRGYFPVYLAGENVKLGELEEEFVHESRAGDAFLLGNSVWRLQSINENRVIVSPAPGAIPKMPFWNGDKSGRGLEAGRRLGSFWRELENMLNDPRMAAWLGELGMDNAAISELTGYLTDQVRHTGYLPTDRRLILESYIDEAGDYRIILHSPYGYRIHSAWEMVARQVAREGLGYELVSVSTDSGIAWHIPRGQAAPPLENLLYLGQDIEQRLMQELPATALFGAFFRMNAARSLVLGRSSPKKRMPLWLQRLKANDLLSLARQESTFPVALETFRECLQDVLDVPGLVELQHELISGSLQVEYHHSVVPSPFARFFILQLTAANMYNDDTPRAEKKAQFLTLDRELLRDMLGEAELRELLDNEAISATIERRQRLSVGLQARNADEMEEVLLDVGDLAEKEVLERTIDLDALPALSLMKRVVETLFPVEPHLRYVAAEEQKLYAEAYGPSGKTQEVARLFLLKRFARTHGPFRVTDVVERYGWSIGDIGSLLDSLRQECLLQQGAFIPNGSGTEWCHCDVLQEIHRRTLAALRREVEAVGEADFTSFIHLWHGVARPTQTGLEALAGVLDKLAGVFLPVEVWERDVLPARLPGYDPAWLDLLCARGEFSWVMQPGGSPDHGRVTFMRREDVSCVCPLLLGNVAPPSLSASAQALQAILSKRGAAFTSELTTDLGSAEAMKGNNLQDALWELMISGRLTNDTYEPVRRGKPVAMAKAVDETKSNTHTDRNHIPMHLRRAVQQRVAAGMNMQGGRWSLVPRSDMDVQTNESIIGEKEWQFERLVEILLNRWGVLCRDMLVSEGCEHLWPTLYRTLQVLEMTGRVRGGYFVAGLAGRQFAHPQAVETLREARQNRTATAPQPVLLSSCDPACIHGALFSAGLPPGTGFVRSPLNYVVIGAGEMWLYISGFGKSLWSPEGIGNHLPEALRLIPRLLSIPGHQRPRRSLATTNYNGIPILESTIEPILRELGFQVASNNMILWPSHLH